MNVAERWTEHRQPNHAVIRIPPDKRSIKGDLKHHELLQLSLAGTLHTSTRFYEFFFLGRSAFLEMLCTASKPSVSLSQLVQCWWSRLLVLFEANIPFKSVEAPRPAISGKLSLRCLDKVCAIHGPQNLQPTPHAQGFEEVEQEQEDGEEAFGLQSLLGLFSQAGGNQVGPFPSMGPNWGCRGQCTRRLADSFDAFVASQAGPVSACQAAELLKIWQWVKTNGTILG